MHTNNSDYAGEEQIKYFCDNVRIRNTTEYFQLQVESGGTSLVFTLTPEHAKRLALALAHHVNQFEELARPLATEWKPDIASPYVHDGLQVTPQEQDALYDDAKAAVIRSRRASPMYLKRKLGIDYARAAKLIELLERYGVVSASDGTSPVRKVLAPSERKKK